MTHIAERHGAAHTGGAPDERRYLSTRQLAELTGLSHVTLELWRRQGRGPAFLRLGRRVRYDMRDVETWMAAQRRGEVTGG